MMNLGERMSEEECDALVDVSNILQGFDLIQTKQIILINSSIRMMLQNNKWSSVKNHAIIN